MPSPAVYAANRLKAIENPRRIAPEPGTRSAVNAGRLSETARVVVLTTEDLAAYKQFARELVDSLDAQTPLERQFAWTIADNQWRINRFRSVEDGMLALGHSEAAGNFDADHPEIHAVMTSAKAFRDHSQAFVNLSICEQRLHRSLKDALRQLKELQTGRRCTQPQIGSVLQNPAPPPPAGNGFVLQNPPCTAGGLAAGVLPEPKIGFVLQKPSCTPTPPTPLAPQT